MTHALLTRSPLYSGSYPPFRARLACVRHAASVDSEPGSNSPVKPIRAAPIGLSTSRPPAELKIRLGPRAEPRFGMIVRYLVFKEPPHLGDSTRISNLAPGCQGLPTILYADGWRLWVGTTA